VFVGDRSDPPAAEANDRVADRIAHVADLAIASLVNDEREQCLRAALGLEHFRDLDVRRRRVAAFERDAA
jgi:hypothetical protein